MKKLLVLSTIVAALASAGVAAADPNGGATVTHTSTCIESPLATWCWDVKTVTKLTTTPSGNVSYTTNGTNDSTVTIPALGCSYTKSEPLHVHWLTQNGETQSYSERLEQTTTFGCAGSVTYTCTSTFEMHLANGDVQFQDGTFECRYV